MRRWAGAALALLAVLGVPVAPFATSASAASAGVHWAIVLRPVTFQVSGATYHLRTAAVDQLVKAEDQSYHEDSIQLVVTSSTSAGPLTHAVQRHYATFVLGYGGDTFTHTRSMSRARVHGPPAQGAANLRIDIRFHATGRTSNGCDGHVQRRTGTMSGTLWFRPVGTRIGAITTVSRHASLIHSDGTCDINPYLQPSFADQRPCDSGTRFVSGFSSPTNNLLALVARRDPHANVAVIRLETDDYRPYGWWQTLRAVIPADRLASAPDLHAVTISGAPGSYLAGSATATSGLADAPVPDPLTFDCIGTGVGASIDRDNGRLIGNLTPEFWAGGDRSLDHVKVNVGSRLILVAP